MWVYIYLGVPRHVECHVLLFLKYYLNFVFSSKGFEIRFLHFNRPLEIYSMLLSPFDVMFIDILSNLGTPIHFPNPCP